MYFDALTLAAVAEELRATILHGRVQRVLLTGPLSLGLEVYAHGRRYQLLASAHPQLARVHLVEGRLTRGVQQETPLLLLLRKYVLGGRITAIEQPPLERVLLLSIVKAEEIRNIDFSPDSPSPGSEGVSPSGNVRARDVLAPRDVSHQLPESLDLQPDDDFDALPDFDDETGEDAELAASPRPRPRRTGKLLTCELIIEPQDRRSNILLVDDNNLILDSIKRVTPRMSSRVVMPRRVYELPPPPDRRDPTLATAAGLAALAETGQSDLVRALVAGYRGVSPQLAREVVFRALGRTQARLDEPLPHYLLAARLREMMGEEAAPSLATGPEGPVAYAPYTLTHLNPVVSISSISAALEQFYASREVVTGHTQRREALVQALGTTRDRLARRHDQLATELERARELDQLRWEGEMIFAFLHSLRPGQTSLEVEGRVINLDPQCSPVEQARDRFRQYEKARSAVAGLPERLAEAETQLTALDQLVVLLQLSDTYEEVEQIAREAEEFGFIREHPDPTTSRRRQRPATTRPLHLVSSDGFDLYIGRSARQNEEVTFRIGRSDDLWVHVRTLHGSHVLVRSGGREVPEPTLHEAACLAAYFSQARDEAAVEVDLCRRALVRKIPGGPPGLVTYRAERTLRVAPCKPSLEAS
ncbi:NFACT family protein [Candidatus Chloroploca sp. M-50]|uniref:Rqc2 homolog RqcH n=1 Tax=Candidatus Chloroploca mongolica TaxID=2528176 RepID=A0ABS4DDQ3_9CHLR|nr:NFACT RNA binding domain-containing protein [Candidatus Chloroploca mongolica]MBP1467562.1 NFACT family protein [Candidatus Chloroploca mongolica]